jgi:hypothetical protein
MEILPKRSSVSGKSPDASSLQKGEIAINIFSGTEGLYTKNSEGVVVKLGGPDIYSLIGSYDSSTGSATGVYEKIVDNEETVGEVLCRLLERVESLESQVVGLKERIDYLESGGEI